MLGALDVGGAQGVGVPGLFHGHPWIPPGLAPAG
jgi:hypothetical protein